MCQCSSPPRPRPRPGGPAAQHRIDLALLPSGPDAVRRLNLHRVRTAVRRADAESVAPTRPPAGQWPMVTWSTGIGLIEVRDLLQVAVVDFSSAWLSTPGRSL